MYFIIITIINITIITIKSLLVLSANIRESKTIILPLTEVFYSSYFKLFVLIPIDIRFLYKLIY